MSTTEPDPGHREHTRRFQRFGVDGGVHIYSGSAMWSTQLIDVSLRGVLVQRPQHWDGAAGQRFRLDFRLPGSVVISMAVELARANEDSLGFACRRIDLTSFGHLKRLIELNLGNAEMLNRELEGLG